MLKPEQIPDEVVDAAVAMRDRGGSMSDIIRTAINAWPGMDISEKITRDKKSGEWRIPIPVLRLPLPKEPET